MVGGGWCVDKILWVVRPGGWDGVDGCYWVSWWTDTQTVSLIYYVNLLKRKECNHFWNAISSPYMLTWVVWHRLLCSDSWKCCSSWPIWVALMLTSRFTDRCLWTPSLRPQVRSGTKLIRDCRGVNRRLLHVPTTRWQKHSIWKSLHLLTFFPFLYILVYIKIYTTPNITMVSAHHIVVPEYEFGCD